ncbi:MAG: SDR family NAD(P)-dependent oxidoreductase, partial [Clostridia bacterium]|nr:SDR family NAD(P)-dependent oxidoreductase [Clostridia bacterium]
MKVPFKVDLSKDVIAITGGGGVLMSAFAECVAECGAKVALLDRNAEAVAAVAASMKDKGYDVIGVAADCMNKASIEAAKDEIEKAFGAVTILINGAGGN